MNGNKYKEVKLKFNLIDTLAKKSDVSKSILEIKFNFDKSEVDSNFSRIRVDSKKIRMKNKFIMKRLMPLLCKKNAKHIYYQKLMI